MLRSLLRAARRALRVIERSATPQRATRHIAQEGSHVSVRIRDVQGRDRAILVAYDGADGGCRALSGQDARRPLRGAWPARIAAWLAGFHRRGTCHRPGRDPWAGWVPPRRLRPRQGRRRAGTDPRDAYPAPAGLAGTGVSSQGRSDL